MSLRFILDGALVELETVDPTATVLDHLRYAMGRTGTKEGCAEGDCGACTVLVGELSEDGDGVVWRSVNACIQFLPMLHGKALLTVESLARGRALNPLQAAMAENGSSQCGFCTPGFVMSLYSKAIGGVGNDLPVEDVIAGNLCRCTGYGPILGAARSTGSLERDDSALTEQLRPLASDDTVSGEYRGRRWFVPRSVTALASLLADHPDARIVGGATDVGLWVNKGLKTLETVIFVGDVAELKMIKEAPEGVTLGAGVRYADAHAAFARLAPELGELTRRIGGLQVRNAGTVGGNIANGSPIGDGPPALIALGATLTLASVEGSRTLPLEDYFIDYGKQDLRSGEFVRSIHIPRPGPNDLVHISKLSRRFDSDISAVCGCFKLTMSDGAITAARVAFGGMAATPRRAPACEAALTGKPFGEITIAAAAEALRGDYSPLTDVRGSADYRLDSAASLLWRLWHKAQGTKVSVLDLVETADG
ncbi:xanthine dehydrogenase small subunit [Altererythrobacter sp. B11]|uniref:xanthine dehydrogenase small subunit n=1 Tax=Altererythrobacter sp. B11 TaxID=2060312 RepID=UPI000DC70EC7|nr:xanthine dehydrogenase small subunit [Altererythrobacter sp. B11]BBC73830.1 xanthine dehydrogenase small subunit [Altererythrobacter sp. B11]